MTTTFYDSDRARRSLISEFRNIWDHRGLVRLLPTQRILPGFSVAPARLGPSAVPVVHATPSPLSE